jgi:hypothetical protein
MSASKKKILEMLAQNKISADDAYKLLNAIEAEEGGRSSESNSRDGMGNTGNQPFIDSGMAGKLKPRYLRVTVTPMEGADPKEVDRVNVRVPMALVRAGLKMTALIPPEALNKTNDALREKGINFDVKSLKPEDLEELITALGDMNVDIETGKGEKVKVFVEY